VLAIIPRSRKPYRFVALGATRKELCMSIVLKDSSAIVASQFHHNRKESIVHRILEFLPMASCEIMQFTQHYIMPSTNFNTGDICICQIQVFISLLQKGCERHAGLLHRLATVISSMEFLNVRRHMDTQPNTEEEEFRSRYASELAKMNDLQLEEERQKVKHQGMKTPRRRGEQIKHDEIDKEIVRRHRELKG
jgi:hypothetical protein